MSFGMPAPIVWLFRPPDPKGSLGLLPKLDYMPYRWRPPTCLGLAATRATEHFSATAPVSHLNNGASQYVQKQHTHTHTSTTTVYGDGSWRAILFIHCLFSFKVHPRHTCRSRSSYFAFALQEVESARYYLINAACHFCNCIVFISRPLVSA